MCTGLGESLDPLAWRRASIGAALMQGESVGKAEKLHGDREKEKDMT